MSKSCMDQMMITLCVVQKKINLSKTVRKVPISSDLSTKGASMRDETLPMPQYDNVCSLIMVFADQLQRTSLLHSLTPVNRWQSPAGSTPTCACASAFQLCDDVIQALKLTSCSWHHGCMRVFTIQRQVMSAQRFGCHGSVGYLPSEARQHLLLSCVSLSCQVCS
jgi:hypothetical protein